MALLCYLTETSVESAALRVLPGTHHRFVPLHADLPEAHAERADRGRGHDGAGDHPDQVTLAVGAGDAVVIDYRLLHATHANRTDRRRDCVLLSFAPDWTSLPSEVRGHLIRHPAQPATRDAARGRSDLETLLPAFDGAVRDLALNRVPPVGFRMQS